MRTGQPGKEQKAVYQFDQLHTQEITSKAFPKMSQTELQTSRAHKLRQLLHWQRWEALTKSKEDGEV